MQVLHSLISALLSRKRDYIYGPMDILHIPWYSSTKFQSIPSRCTIFKLSLYLYNLIFSNRIYIKVGIDILCLIVCWVFWGQRDSFNQGWSYTYKTIIKFIGDSFPIFRFYPLLANLVQHCLCFILLISILLTFRDFFMLDLSCISRSWSYFLWADHRIWFSLFL